jgi:Complex I intermediate-associated protein 30 (CIA30)
MATGLIAVSTHMSAFHSLALPMLLSFIANPIQHDRADVDVVLASFSDPYSIKMKTIDDPVMGGSSHSSFILGVNRLVWEGEVETVSFLDAPGFCNLQTADKQDFSILKDSTGISFLVSSSGSDFLHPMGLQIENGERTKFGIPVVYWCQGTEIKHLDDDTIEMYAKWEDFTATAYGQDVKAPALTPENLSKTFMVGLTTYLSHQSGPFRLELLSIVARGMKSERGKDVSRMLRTATVE